MPTDPDATRSPESPRRRRRLVPSRRRLVTSIVSALLVVLIGSGAVAVVVIRDQLIERIDRDLQTSSQSLTAVLTPAEVKDIISSSDVTSSSQAILLFDQDGNQVADIAAGSPTKQLPLPDLSNFTYADLRARVGQPFTRNAEGDPDLQYRVLVTEIGDDGELLVTAVSLTDVNDTVGLLAIILLGSAAAAVIVLSGLIWLISRNALQPIDDMIEVAGAIGQGDLGARIAQDTNNAEVARLSDALNSMLNQLEAAFAAKDQSETKLRRFAADASHELRTPLTTIQGWADMYHAGGRDDGLTDKAMDRISREAARMSALVADLLLLARLDQERPMASYPVDLAGVLADSADDLRAIQPQRPLTVELDPGDFVVIGDEARIRQVVSNLLTNISVHTDPEVAAWIRLTADGDRAVVTIADDGPGLSATDAERVFDRFYRAEDSRSRLSGGSGLGLSIVHSVIESHQGSIELTTAPGAGATFTITLPLQRSQEPAVPG